MKLCPFPDYAGVAETLEQIHEDGGFSSNVICEMGDALEPWGWLGCGDEMEALHDALVALVKTEPFGFWDVPLMIRIASRLCELTAAKWKQAREEPRKRENPAPRPCRECDEPYGHKIECDTRKGLELLAAYRGYRGRRVSSHVELLDGEMDFWYAAKEAVGE